MSDFKKSEYKIEEISCPVCGKDTAKVISHVLDIPYYSDFLMLTITCSSCGYRANDFMNMQIKDHTIQRYRVETEADSTTKIARSRDGTIRIPDLGISIDPVGEGSTWIRNIEGILEDIKEKLLISLKEAEDQESKRQIRQRLKKLKEFLSFTTPFVIEVEDPSGNSVILPADKDKLETTIVPKN